MGWTVTAQLTAEVYFSLIILIKITFTKESSVFSDELRLQSEA